MTLNWDFLYAPRVLYSPTVLHKQKIKGDAKKTTVTFVSVAQRILQLALSSFVTLKVSIRAFDNGTARFCRSCGLGSMTQNVLNHDFQIPGFL